MQQFIAATQQAQAQSAFAHDISAKNSPRFSTSAKQVPPEIRRALNAEVPKFADAKVPPQIGGEQRRMLEKVLDESFVRSFRVAMLVAASLALASALCAGLMIGPQRKNPPVA